MLKPLLKSIAIQMRAGGTRIVLHSHIFISHWTDPKPAVDQNLESYQSMFDDQGKFKHNLFNNELPKEEFKIFEETDKDIDVEEDEIIEYNHIRTPLYTIRLSSAYEDNASTMEHLKKE